MAYHEEVFSTREERNARSEELKQTHSGVVIYSTPIKIGFDEQALKSIYKTDWIVAYPQLGNIGQLAQEAIERVQIDAVKHDQELS